MPKLQNKAFMIGHYVFSP